MKLTIENLSRENINESISEWDHVEKVKLAVYCAELSICIFERKYPNDNHPRLAIEAAKEWCEYPTEEKKQKCADAAAVYAPYAHYAAYATTAATYAAYAVADTAYATYAAYAVADTAAVDGKFKQKLVDYISGVNEVKASESPLKAVFGQGEQLKYTSDIALTHKQPCADMLCRIEHNSFITGSVITANVTFKFETDKGYCFLCEGGLIASIDKECFIAWHAVDERSDNEVEMDRAKRAQRDEAVDLLNRNGQHMDTESLVKLMQQQGMSAEIIPPLEGGSKVLLRRWLQGAN